jgi:hypothetical protein
MDSAGAVVLDYCATVRGRQGHERDSARSFCRKSQSILLAGPLPHDYIPQHEHGQAIHGVGGGGCGLDIVLGATGFRLRRRPMWLRGLDGDSCPYLFLEFPPMVDRSPPLVGRACVHVALGAPPVSPLAGRFRSRFVMRRSQPVRLAYRVPRASLSGRPGPKSPRQTDDERKIRRQLSPRTRMLVLPRGIRPTRLVLRIPLVSGRFAPVRRVLLPADRYGDHLSSCAAQPVSSVGGRTWRGSGLERWIIRPSGRLVLA